VIRSDGRREYWVEGRLLGTSSGPRPILLSIITAGASGILPFGMAKEPVKYTRSSNCEGKIGRDFFSLITTGAPLTEDEKRQMGRDPDSIGGKDSNPSLCDDLDTQFVFDTDV
jgi:hypothetical protein